MCKVWPIPSCTPTSHFVFDFEEGQTSASHKSTAHGARVCDTSLPVLKLLSPTILLLNCLPRHVCNCNSCFPVCPMSNISNMFDIYEIGEALTRVVTQLYIMLSSISSLTSAFLSILSPYINTQVHYRLLLLITSQF